MSKESRPKKSKYDNKERSTINVSLQKRNLGLLNSILNGWVEDGYNISHEICKAIIFKNKSDINPHIRTILSTLSLIESSLKSQRMLKGMSDEEIDSKALEIFNEVITIDIDGAKLTNLLKSVDMPSRKQISSKSESESTTENILESNTTKMEYKKELIIQDTLFENEVENEVEYQEISATVKVEDEVQSIKSSNKSTTQKATLDWSKSFPKEKVEEKKMDKSNISNHKNTSSDNNNVNSTIISNNIIKGFVANPGFV